MLEPQDNWRFRDISVAKNSEGENSAENSWQRRLSALLGRTVATATRRSQEGSHVSERGGGV